jgi:hypothetical protein
MPVWFGERAVVARVLALDPPAPPPQPPPADFGEALRRDLGPLW